MLFKLCILDKCSHTCLFSAAAASRIRVVLGTWKDPASDRSASDTRAFPTHSMWNLLSLLPPISRWNEQFLNIYFQMPSYLLLYGIASMREHCWPSTRQKKKKPKQNSGEPFCLEMEAIKLDGKAHSSHPVMRISFQWNTEVKFKKKKADFCRFFKYTGVAVKITIFKMQLLLCYFIWFRSAFQIRQCCLCGLLSQICWWLYHL